MGTLGSARVGYTLKFGIAVLGIGLLFGGATVIVGGFGDLYSVIFGVVVGGLIGMAAVYQTMGELVELIGKAENNEPPEAFALPAERGGLTGTLASILGSAQSSRRRIDSVEETALEYTVTIQECADGDLTRRLDTDVENENLSTLAGDINEMLENLEATVGSLTDFANEVATYSQEVRMSTEEVRDGSEHVSASIREISENAERQLQDLATASSEMDEFSTTVEEIADSSNEVATLSERTVKTGRKGREAAQEAIQSMSAIENKSVRTVEQIERLEESVEQIDELIDFITEIADQTNMLALNANIEASRAGEYGDGFAAVANEIKELAERTKDATGDIEGRLAEIQAQTDRTVTEVQETSDRIAENTDSVENAVEALDEIASLAQETNEGVQAINRTTEREVETTKEVARVVEGASETAATISEETTAESETVGAAAEAQTTALEHIALSAGELADRATQLSGRLGEFDADPDVDRAFEFDGADRDGEVEGKVTEIAD